MNRAGLSGLSQGLQGGGDGRRVPMLRQVRDGVLRWEAVAVAAPDARHRVIHVADGPAAERTLLGRRPDVGVIHITTGRRAWQGFFIYEGRPCDLAY